MIQLGSALKLRHIVVAPFVFAHLYEVSNAKQLSPSRPHPSPSAGGKVAGEREAAVKESATRNRDELRRQARIFFLANDAVRVELRPLSGNLPLACPVQRAERTEVN